MSGVESLVVRIEGNPLLQGAQNFMKTLLRLLNVVSICDWHVSCSRRTRNSWRRTRRWQYHSCRCRRKPRLATYAPTGLSCSRLLLRRRKRRFFLPWQTSWLLCALGIPVWFLFSSLLCCAFFWRINWRFFLCGTGRRHCSKLSKPFRLPDCNATFYCRVDRRYFLQRCCRIRVGGAKCRAGQVYRWRVLHWQNAGPESVSNS